MTIQTVLFDLDGTLLDTAPDIIYALNQLRQNFGLKPDLRVATSKHVVSVGSKALLKHAINVDENDPRFPEMRAQFLQVYEAHIADLSAFFPNIDQILSHLEEQHIPWGIVTNRHTDLTRALLKALEIEHRPPCIVCGDTLPYYKPHPAPILHACELLKQDPAHCIYIGDAMTDVQASKAAGTQSLVALYGYIGQEEDPYAWQADGYIKDPLEILNWLK